MDGYNKTIDNETKPQGIHSRKEIKGMSVITITKDNFESEVLKSPVPVLLDFWATVPYGIPHRG